MSDKKSTEDLAVVVDELRFIRREIERLRSDWARLLDAQNDEVIDAKKKLRRTLTTSLKLAAVSLRLRNGGVFGRKDADRPPGQ